MRRQTAFSHVFRFVLLGVVGFVYCVHVFAQVSDGELRVVVRDPAGRAVPAEVVLVSRNPQFRAQAIADDTGEARLQRLPLGVYRLSVTQPGFQAFEETIEIRSAVPLEKAVALSLSVVATQVDVSESAPLLDPLQATLVMQASRAQLDQAMGTTLGRSTVDIVTTMPGWLLEANAVLHPRGSEYDTQYVIDGMPVYENRSIAFAPGYENDEFEAVNVLTAGMPAEFGRRLGGVIALDTRREGRMGSSSELTLQTGSFNNHAGSFAHQYRYDRGAVSLGAHGGMTDRYLDPPSLENFTNSATARGFNARIERDLNSSDRLSLYFRGNRSNFLVPNDLVQQRAGQRQDRRAGEIAGQIHYQHVFNSRVLGTVRGMVRDLNAKLWSNPESTPVYVEQDRSLGEGVVLGSLTVENEHHTIKLGGDLRLNSIRERFVLAEPDELPDLDVRFLETERSKEASAFVQDSLRWGRFSANVGIRFDRYSMLIEDSAFSPRAAVSYYIPRADLMLRASYDRIFQPPPAENLLLSSAAEGLDIGDVDDVIPVPTSRANFFEVGLRKPFSNAFRLDASYFWRRFRNYIDDDVFFNTGLSFPITFDAARIQGAEVRLEMPRWRFLSGALSYSNMIGRASSPVTGGLFIEGSEAEELRDVVEEFAITQDQRNTVAGLVRIEPHRRVWFAVDTRYGSGLPVELEEGDDDEDDDDDVQPISQSILDKVDFERGRVRPNFSLNFSAGFRLWERDNRAASVQLDVRNVTDRLNVINFSGLFSGTALAPGRQITLQTRFRF